MTECNGCGRCCDPVALPYRVAGMGPEQIALIDPGDRDWVLNHLTEIRPRRDGLAMVRDYMRDGMTWGLGLDGRMAEVVTFFYSCDFYDPETREGLAYDERPDVCSDYPWYGMPPDASKAIPPDCEFNLDIGKPVAVTLRSRP